MHVKKHPCSTQVFWMCFYLVLPLAPRVLFPLTFLQPVDVLGVHPQKQPFVVKHVDKVVYVVRSVAPGIERLGQGEERLRVVGEVINVENGFRVRDVVLLQVGVKARSRGSENVEIAASW